MLQGHGHAHSHSDSVVKIKSLPFDATQLDVLQFFDGFKMKPNGVQLVVRSDNKPTGEVRAEEKMRRWDAEETSCYSPQAGSLIDIPAPASRHSLTLRAQTRPAAPSERRTTRSSPRSLATATFA